jgi:putative DNA primase/helicase
VTSSERNGRPRPRLPTPAVSGRDLAGLRESGLTDETIRENGIYTVGGSTKEDWIKLATILNQLPERPPKEIPWFCRGGGLVFPYRDLDGTPNDFVRVRPHEPRTRDGRPVKYEQPAGVPPRAYFPGASLPLLNDGTSPVFVTEGEKKALAQLGLAAVGIGGVWCWKAKDAEELIPDLATVPWAGRTAHIVFDWDPKPETRKQTAAAGRRLAKALRAAGVGDLRLVELPPGPDGGKQGVDDFIVANGGAAFLALLEEAEAMPDRAEIASLTRAEGCTDAANAARLVRDHGAVARWVGPWDKWLVWDETRWERDQTRRLDALAKGTAAGLFNKIATLLKGGGEDIGDKTRNVMCAHARYSNSRKGVENMVALARSDLAILPDELDRDPWLLNLENGTLDLRAGALRGHRKEDFITKRAPVAFDPGAPCPRWRAFLERIFAGNADLILYLQRLVGYCLTGVTREHILPVLHGSGSNGKSTFCETLLALLGGDYAMKAAPDLLMVKRGESHPTERADLFGMRFVACIETEEGRRLAEVLVKELTGGDRVRARRMREDFWEFAPTHHVWLATNHKPVIRGTDEGIWRRIKLIPFDVRIPDAEQDKELGDKLAAELPGILNWARAGCLDWQRGGLREPEVVRVATKGYEAEMDEVGDFLDEHCERGSDFRAMGAELFERFQKATGSQITPHSFAERLRRAGFENRRTTGGRKCWCGLQLRPEVSDQARAAAREFRAKKAGARGE